jgi:hypothetical protein
MQHSYSKEKREQQFVSKLIQNLRPLLLGFDCLDTSSQLLYSLRSPDPAALHNIMMASELDWNWSCSRLYRGPGFYKDRCAM